MRVKTALIGEEEENNENGRRRSSAAQYMERESARASIRIREMKWSKNSLEQMYVDPEIPPPRFAVLGGTFLERCVLRGGSGLCAAPLFAPRLGDGGRCTLIVGGAFLRHVGLFCAFRGSILTFKSANTSAGGRAYLDRSSARPMRSV